MTGDSTPAQPSRFRALRSLAAVLAVAALTQQTATAGIIISAEETGGNVVFSYGGPGQLFAITTGGSSFSMNGAINPAGGSNNFWSWPHANARANQASVPGYAPGGSRD